MKNLSSKVYPFALTVDGIENVPNTRQHSIIPIFALLGVVLFSLAFRIEWVHQPLVDAFAWREASTAMMADNLPSNSWNPLWPEVSWNGDLPGYQGREFQTLTFAAAVLDNIFGWRDWTGRIVAMIASGVTVACIFLLANAIAGTKSAILSGMAYALLPQAIVIDSSYLPDALMLALATSAVWFTLAGLRHEKSGHLFLGLFLFTFALLAKLPSIGLLPAFLYVIVSHKKSLFFRSWEFWYFALTILLGFAVVTYYIWIVDLARHFPPHHVAGGGFISEDGIWDFVERGFYAQELGEWFVTGFSIPILLLAIFGVFLPSGRDRSWYLPHWMLFGAFFVFLTSAREMVTNPWNLHTFSVPVAMLSGYALARVSDLVGRSVWRQVAFIGICITSLAFLARPEVLTLKTPYAADDRDLGIALHEQSKPGELVISAARDAGSPIAIYYSRRRGWVFPSNEMTSTYGTYTDDGQQAIAALEEMKDRGARWFGINKHSTDDYWQGGRKFTTHYKRLLDHLNTSYRQQVDNPAFVIYNLSEPPI